MVAAKREVGKRKLSARVRVTRKRVKNAESLGKAPPPGEFSV
jgi:hypothetical protein